jgi:hypothetical protein
VSAIEDLVRPLRYGVWRIASCGDDTGPVDWAMPVIWAMDEEHGDNAKKIHAEG